MKNDRKKKERKGEKELKMEGGRDEEGSRKFEQD
jgi:hypothetical protein